MTTKQSNFWTALQSALVRNGNPFNIKPVQKGQCSPIITANGQTFNWNELMIDLLIDTNRIRVNVYNANNSLFYDYTEQQKDVINGKLSKPVDWTISGNIRRIEFYIDVDFNNITDAKIDKIIEDVNKFLGVFEPLLQDTNSWGGNAKSVRGASSALNNTGNSSSQGGRVKVAENIIYYGVPGCGKSFCIKEKIKNVVSIADESSYKRFEEKNVIRVVFHPDYTYSDFVGQILPKLNAATGTVSYEFAPGPFTRALKKAIVAQNAAVGQEDNNERKEIFLVIEEINRGNAAAIFGDIFQLLDRNAQGESEYGIENEDILNEVYQNANSKPSEVKLPSNLWIMATMNTSDQNVFTLDTAFQRRWDMELVRNQFSSAQYFTIAGTNAKWPDFALAINAVLANQGGIMSTEDKSLGAWFVKPDQKDSISKERFANKVLKYLWDDAFKYNRDLIFNEDYKTLENVMDKFVSNPGDVFSDDNIKKLF